MDPSIVFFRDTQTLVQLIGSACSKHPFSAEEAQVLEWALAQIAMDGSGPVTEVLEAYRSSLLAGAEWHAAIAAALLQTPRQWGAEIQAAMHAFDEIRSEYRTSDVAVFQFADKVITEHSHEIPPLPGFIPAGAPHDPRPSRLFEIADQFDVAREVIELAKVFQDRFPLITKRGYKLSFSGSLAALFCDLGIEPEQIPRLLTVAAMVSLIFRPVRRE